MRLVFHKPYPVADEKDLILIPSVLCRNGKIIKACPDAVGAFKEMCAEAQKENVQLLVLSSHRTVELQETLFKEAEIKHGKGKGILWLAPPGYSEHHTGYAFDLADKGRPETDDESSFEETPASKWLFRNANRFGFELSFSKDNWQGIGYEPWHWRYVGNEKSRKIFHRNIFYNIFDVTKTVLNTIFLAMKSFLQGM